MARILANYLQNCQVAEGTIGTDDLLLVLQGGQLKKITPGAAAIVTDISGSDKRCLVQATYDGVDVEGKDIWSLLGKTV